VSDWLASLTDSWPWLGGGLTALLSCLRAYRWFRRRHSSRRTIFARFAEFTLSPLLLKKRDWDLAVERAENERLRRENAELHAELSRCRTTSGSAASNA